MDGMSLLQRAQQAGLAVQVDGDNLVIRGPKRAEPLARMLIERKPEVLALLSPRKRPEGHVWRARYCTRTAHWSLNGQRSWQEAQRIAYGELLVNWHREYGSRPDPNRCAGCGDDLPPNCGLVLDQDGSRVHFDGARGVDCISAYGMKWRNAAIAGLRVHGIEPLAGEENAEPD